MSWRLSQRRFTEAADNSWQKFELATSFERRLDFSGRPANL